MRTTRLLASALTVGALCAVGAPTATAVNPGWHSGWRDGTSIVAPGCGAKILYGRTWDRGIPFAFGSVSNPACQVRVGVKVTSTFDFSGWSNTGVYREAWFAWPYATYTLDLRIPAWGQTVYSESFYLPVRSWA